MEVVSSINISMGKNKLLIRSAKEKDAHQIANVLLDFYNMENKDEATKVFINEREKDFHYIVAIENNEILGLVTWLVHGLYLSMVYSN